MYHSLSEPILEPSLGDRTIFYAGINWERMGKQKGRYQDLLDRLDSTALSIYGPKVFLGIDVWKGYKSYRGPIPFDGVTILREINRCGIAFVFSSDAHKDSELMSNRLFESLAAGAFVICDENPFAYRYFQDTLLYVETRRPTEQVFEAVMKHVQWVRSHPVEAMDMIRAAQRIFREKFLLTTSLVNIYSNLQERRATLERLYAPAITDTPVALFFLVPEYSPEVLDRHLTSIAQQRHAGCQATLLIDTADLARNKDAIVKAVSQPGASIAVRGVVYREVDETGGIVRRARLGEVISDAIREIPSASMLCIVAPDEQLFSDHIQSLVGVFGRSPQASVAHSHLLYRNIRERTLNHDLQEELNFLNPAQHEPLGFGRFLFRRSAFAESIHSALRYVDSKAIVLLVAACPARGANPACHDHCRHPVSL